MKVLTIAGVVASIALVPSVSTLTALEQAPAERVYRDLFVSAVEWAAEEYATPVSDLVVETEGSGYWLRGPDAARERVVTVEGLHLVSAAVGAIAPRAAADIWTCTEVPPAQRAEIRRSSRCELSVGALQLRINAVGKVTDSATLSVRADYPSPHWFNSGVQVQIWRLHLRSIEGRWIVTEAELIGRS